MAVHDYPRTLRSVSFSHEEGNAEIDSRPYRGWFIGNFIPDDLNIRSSGDVEVKWGVHQPGEAQAEWTANKTATTISILVRGKDRIIFPDGEVLLEQEGDYAVWGPGVPHRWHAIDHCVVISVRWPSVVNDSIQLSSEEVMAFPESLSA